MCGGSNAASLGARLASPDRTHVVVAGLRSKVPGGPRGAAKGHFEESDEQMTHIARKLPLISIAAAFIAMAFASTAMAADSSVETYGGSGGNVQSNIQTGDPGGSATDPGGGLPFTGLDLALVAGGGVLLLGAGATVTGLAARTRPGTHPTN